MNINGNKEMELKMIIRIENAIENFGGMIKVGCSGSYIFRAERGSRRVPVHMRVNILKKGLNWNSNEIECFLIETVKKYEQNR